MKRIIVAVIFISSLLSTARVFANDKLAPEVVDRSIKRSLQQCFQRAERAAHKTNMLLAPALTACYLPATYAWQTAISKAKAQLGVDPNTVCGQLVADIEQTWKVYSNKALNLQPLQDMPVNTNDDIELLMHKHFYEIIYSLRLNPSCKKP